MACIELSPGRCLVEQCPVCQWEKWLAATRFKKHGDELGRQRNIYHVRLIEVSLPASILAPCLEAKHGRLLVRPFWERQRTGHLRWKLGRLSPTGYARTNAVILHVFLDIAYGTSMGNLLRYMGYVENLASKGPWGCETNGQWPTSYKTPCRGRDLQKVHAIWRALDVHKASV